MERRGQDALYEQAITEHGTIIRRLSRGYEADPERRRDLLQEIHLELWRSLKLFDGRCALRTWVYRVAHNVAASYIVGQRRIGARLVDLEALDMEPVPIDGEEQADHRHAHFPDAFDWPCWSLGLQSGLRKPVLGETIAGVDANVDLLASLEVPPPRAAPHEPN